MMDSSIPNPPPAPEDVVTPRQAEACRYKRSGHSYADIARMMGVSERNVRKLLTEAFKTRSAYEQFDREEARQQALDQLDVLLVRAMEMVEATGDKARGDSIALAALDRVVAIQERKAKLMGLDTGERPPSDEMPTTRDELIKELRDGIRAMKQNGKAPEPSPN